MVATHVALTAQAGGYHMANIIATTQKPFHSQEVGIGTINVVVGWECRYVYFDDLI